MTDIFMAGVGVTALGIFVDHSDPIRYSTTPTKRFQRGGWPLDVSPEASGQIYALFQPSV